MRSVSGRPPQQCMAATAAHGPPPSMRHDRTAGLSEARARAAAAAEARSALTVGVVAGVPALLLVAVDLLAAAGAFGTAVGGDSAGLWARSMLSLVLLCVATQLVAALLAIEHRVPAASGSSVLVEAWAARTLVLLAVAASVLVACVGVSTWGTAGLLGLVAEMGALGALLWTWHRAAPLDEVPRDLEDHLPPAEAATGLEKRRLRAIGASGGGIRAAAFVLGGHQAVQDLSAQLGIDGPEREPEVFAVSGGSYIAAALAMRRTYKLDGTRRVPHDEAPPSTTPAPWAKAFAMDSPELERLRRHTRYLFEPTWQTRDGVTSLAVGAVISLVIVALVLRLIVWFGSQLAVSVGFVGTPAEDDVVALPVLAPAWGLLDWWPVLAVPLLCLGGLFSLSWIGWRATGAFDTTPRAARRGHQQVGVHDEVAAEAHEDEQERRAAIRRLKVVARWRSGLVFAALGWLVLVAGLPAASIGVTHLVTTNQPTATVASLLRSAGFASATTCTESFVLRVDEALERVADLGRVSPGARQEVTTGACGREVEVVGTFEPGEEVVEVDGVEAAARDLADGDSWSGEVAGVSVLLALVGALLRRGPSPETSVEAGLRTRVKRSTLTWLPLVITGGLAVYLALLWSFGFLQGLDSSHLVLTVVLTVLAFTLAFLVDANATSVHSFYRARLSDAFAVGVDESSGRAAELPPHQVYRFSDLRREDETEDRPRLHIVTTLNSRAANEAPTMRGGFPMVFGPDEVCVHREEGRRVHVDSRVYEDFAGPGRVSIMATVATSGAAISPLMGRYAAQMAPYRLLLALFNIRVGAWVRNPLHAGLQKDVPDQWPRFLWMTRKPGLVQVALEAVGTSSAESRWIYLSDGGHLDNTGLVECVRHCVAEGKVGRVLVLDASNDPVESWSAVGDAIGVIRADLNIDLRRVFTVGLPPWARRYQGQDLDVLTVKAVRTGPPSEDSTETNWWQVLPANVQSFQLVHADFPRSSTARQKFGDLEFEAYRGLGYASTTSALVAASWIPEPDR